MPEKGRSGRTLDTAVNAYIASRRLKTSLILTNQAVRAIRSVVPNCSESDEQIVEAIAAAAIKVGEPRFFI
jgi:hypothetical protein